MRKATDKQIGGSHYKNLPIQPTEYITKNELGWCEGNIVKYITRHKAKGNRDDVLKVIHYAELLLELEYPLSMNDESLPVWTTGTREYNPPAKDGWSGGYLKKQTSSV